MADDRLDRLTEKQRECLRHVYAHLSSKEIAPLLDVEPGTVDQYIKAALRVLGVSDRRAAARVLAQHEAPTAQPLVYQPLDIAPAPNRAMIAASTEGQPGSAPGGTMREDRALFDISPPAAQGFFQPPLPIGGRKPSDLSRLSRLGWIGGLILLIALAFGVFITGVEALSRLGRMLG